MTLSVSFHLKRRRKEPSSLSAALLVTERLVKRFYLGRLPRCFRDEQIYLTPHWIYSHDISQLLWHPNTSVHHLVPPRSLWHYRSVLSRFVQKTANILQETERLIADPAPGIKAAPHEDNLRYFDVEMAGPFQSPFEGMLP